MFFNIKPKHLVHKQFCIPLLPPPIYFLYSLPPAPLYPRFTKRNLTLAAKSLNLRSLQPELKTFDIQTRNSARTNKPKELSLYHKLKCSKLYIFRT